MRIRKFILIFISVIVLEFMCLSLVNIDFFNSITIAHDKVLMSKVFFYNMLYLYSAFTIINSIILLLYYKFLNKKVNHYYAIFNNFIYNGFKLSSNDKVYLDQNTLMNNEFKLLSEDLIYLDKKLKEFIKLIRFNERKYKKLIENSPYGIIIINKSGNLLFNNKLIYDILKIEYKDITIDFNLFTFFNKYDIIINTIKNSIDKKISINFEIEYNNNIRLKFNVIPTISINESYNILIIIEDYSNKYNIENNLKNNIEKYENLYNLLLTIADTIPDMLWAKDIDGKYIFGNKNICNKLLNSNPIDIIGKTDIELSTSIKEKYKHTFGECCVNSDIVIIKDQKPNIFHEYGYSINEWVDLEVHKAPLYSSNNTLIGVVGVGRNITERLNQENIIKKSEEKFRLIFEKSPLGLFYFNSSGIILDNNNIMLNVFNISKNDILKLNVIDYLNNLADKNIIKLTKDNWYEGMFNNHYYRFNIKRIENNGGIGTVQDITLEKMYDIKINEINQKLKEAQSIAKIGSWYKDFITNEVYWSDELYNIFEIDKEHSHIIDLDEVLYDNIYYEDIDMVKNRIENAIKNKYYTPLKFRLLINNKIKYIYSEAKLTYNEKEEIITISGIDQDITDKMSYKIALENTENKYKALIDSTIVSIGIFDLLENIIFINNSFCNLLGYTYDELSKLQLVNILESSNYDKLKKAKRCKVTKYYEFKLMHKNKEYRDVYVTISSLIENNIITGTIFICIDITDKKHIENEIAIKNKELIEKNKQLEQFSYVTAHDLKTPLRTIIGFVQMIERHINDKSMLINYDKINIYSDFIKKAITQMNNIIDDSLTYSKIDKNLKIENYDIQDVFNLFLLTIDSLIKENKDIKINIFSDSFIIKVDKSSFVSVLQNLISNAIKFNDKPKKIINIKYEFIENYIKIIIEDNGIGIEDKYYEKIFKMFQRLHGSDIPGTGIGLAIVKKIIDAHSGKIELYSKVDIGTTFIIFIPN